MSNLPNLAFSPAADRNKQAILDLLKQVLPKNGSVLEIASGTGQHIIFFAAAMPHFTWQPTDAEVDSLPVIAQYAKDANLLNVRAPRRLDVMAAQWPAEVAAFTESFDAIYCANMLHIAPWATCAALMHGAARHLATKGVLITYGPYLEDDVSTSAGNQSFDQSLRAQNQAWGIRRREDVEQEARLAGLHLIERHTMPSNNLLLVWAKKA